MTRDIDELDDELARYDKIIEQADGEAAELLAKVGHDITAWVMEADEEVMYDASEDLTPAQELLVQVRNEEDE